jgi:NAD(P)-dependent dehydrogenase (short-subunit alcohol dehydrogenase family)
MTKSNNGNMEQKTVLITGVTGTIGKAAATELAKDNCRLILLGRDMGRLSAVKSEIAALTGNNDLDIYVADLSEPESIRQTVRNIKRKYTYLNVLVNVAGVFKNKRLENSAGLEYMFATNHLGPFVLTNELLDLLKSGKGRIINISAPSTTKINFDNLQGKNKFSTGFLGLFGASKMMNIMFTYALARRLDGSGVSAIVFHPGLVKSGLTNEMPAILDFIFKRISSKPDKAAGMIRHLAFEEEFESKNGKFFQFQGKEIKSAKYSYDQGLQEKLWTISEQLSE